MKSTRIRLYGMAALLLFALFSLSLNAQTGGYAGGHRGGDVGMQDVDDDGIPNCLDPDYVPGNPEGVGHGWVDSDGDGINDRQQDDDGDGILNCQDPDSGLFSGSKKMAKHFWGNVSGGLQQFKAAVRNRFGNRSNGSGQ